MQRRKFITLLGGVAATAVSWPLVARAQPVMMPVIGFLHVGSADTLSHLVTAFRQGLKQIGYVEGQKVTIEFHWAQGHYDRLPAFAADLVHRQVAAIVTGGGDPPAAIAKAATATIPIVFNVGSDPSKTGLVASLSRPGGNATGVNIFTAELASKRMGPLDELVPKTTVTAFLVNPNFPPSAANAREVQAAARKIGRQILLLNASNASEIDAAFATLHQRRAGAVIVGAERLA